MVVLKLRKLVLMSLIYLKGKIALVVHRKAQSWALHFSLSMSTISKNPSIFFLFADDVNAICAD